MISTIYCPLVLNFQKASLKRSHCQGIWCGLNTSTGGYGVHFYILSLEGNLIRLSTAVQTNNAHVYFGNPVEELPQR